MRSALPVIAVTLGDPAGIGPEVAVQALADPAVRAVCRPLLIGDARVARRALRLCGFTEALDIIEAARIGGSQSAARLQLLDVPCRSDKPPAYGELSAAAGDAAVRAVETAIDLIAKFPTIVATWDRMRRGLEPIAPDPALHTAANFLYMRTGEKPIPEAEKALDTYLILLADHSYNASTFSARVTASTAAAVPSAAA